MAKGIFTKVGREKLCKAHAGQRSLPKITRMAFGNGGVDAGGNVRETTGSETALKAELLKKELDGFSFPEPATARYTVRLTKEELAGELISEQGLFDEEEDLIIYKTFLPKGKDADVEFVFDMDEIF